MSLFARSVEQKAPHQPDAEFVRIGNEHCEMLTRAAANALAHEVLPAEVSQPMVESAIRPSAQVYQLDAARRQVADAHYFAQYPQQGGNDAIAA